MNLTIDRAVAILTNLCGEGTNTEYNRGAAEALADALNLGEGASDALLTLAFSNSL